MHQRPRTLFVRVLTIVGVQRPSVAPSPSAQVIEVERGRWHRGITCSRHRNG